MKWNERLEKSGARLWKACRSGPLPPQALGSSMRAWFRDTLATLACRQTWSVLGVSMSKWKYFWCGQFIYLQRGTLPHFRHAFHAGKRQLGTVLCVAMHAGLCQGMQSGFTIPLRVLNSIATGGELQRFKNVRHPNW